MSDEFPHKAYVVAPPDSPRPEHPLPSPGIQTPGAASGDTTLCDCTHTAYEHTDRGEQDAGLCLHPGCHCPEFVEAEDPPDAPSLRAALAALVDESQTTTLVGSLNGVPTRFTIAPERCWEQARVALASVEAGQGERWLTEGLRCAVCGGPIRFTHRFPDGVSPEGHDGHRAVLAKAAPAPAAEPTPAAEGQLVDALGKALGERFGGLTVHSWGHAKEARAILTSLELAGWRLPAQATGSGGLDVERLRESLIYAATRHIGPGLMDMTVWQEIAATASVQYAATLAGGEAGEHYFVGNDYSRPCVVCRLPRTDPVHYLKAAPAAGSDR